MRPVAIDLPVRIRLTQCGQLARYSSVIQQAEIPLIGESRRKQTVAMVIGSMRLEQYRVKLTTVENQLNLAEDEVTGTAHSTDVVDISLDEISEVLWKAAKGGE